MRFAAQRCMRNCWVRKTERNLNPLSCPSSTILRVVDATFSLLVYMAYLDSDCFPTSCSAMSVLPTDALVSRFFNDFMYALIIWSQIPGRLKIYMRSPDVSLEISSWTRGSSITGPYRHTTGSTINHLTARAKTPEALARLHSIFLMTIAGSPLSMPCFWTALPIPEPTFESENEIRNE